MGKVCKGEAERWLQGGGYEKEKFSDQMGKGCGGADSAGDTDPGSTHLAVKRACGRREKQKNGRADQVGEMGDLFLAASQDRGTTRFGGLRKRRAGGKRFDWIANLDKNNQSPA